MTLKFSAINVSFVLLGLVFVELFQQTPWGPFRKPTYLYSQE
jgi:hypothetical protein